MTAWFQRLALTHTPRWTQWCLLLAMSVVLVALLQWARLPAALMLGPMIAGILMETGGGNIRVPTVPFWISQAVIGCLIARVITPQILSTFMSRWPLFIAIILAVIVSSGVLGWILTRIRLFPDTTAIWGLLPGAASVMMLMADEFGADGRLVAFIQYLRVVFVAIAASVMARFWFHTSSNLTATVWFPDIHWIAFLETAFLIIASMALTRKFKIPAGIILVSMVLGTTLNTMSVLTIELPQWLLAASYASLGWTIGLRFNREILSHAVRTLPQIIIAVILLMAVCGGLALVLVRMAGVDPLTAYLATNPGGMDSAAIIAASSKVNMPFVMSMQVARFLLVLLVGPILSRWLARSLPGARPAKALPESDLT